MKERVIEIDVIRVLAMVFIIICHVLLEKNIVWGQFFNVGVIEFLFISGFCFGKKDILNVGQWIKRRLLRILPEYYIFIFIYVFFLIVINYRISIKEVFVNIFLLQGIFTEMALPNIGHLWFLTYILICYIMTPLLQKICKENKNSLPILIVFIGSIQVVSVFIRYIGINLVGARFAAYILGYYISSKKINTDNGNQIIFRYCKMLTFPTIILNTVRFFYELSDIGNRLPLIFDLGFSLIWQWVQCLLGIWISLIIWNLTNKYMKRGAINRYIQILISKVAEYSFSIYIVHQIFIYHDFAITRYINPYPLGLIIAFLFIIVCGIILNQLSNYVRKLLIKV